MKVLTVLQPYATALATGMKRFETRPRRLHHRGPIAIHAGKTFMDEGFDQVKHLDWGSQLIRPLSRRYALVDGSDFPMGAIIAIANMVDCHEMTPEFIAQQTPQEIALGHWEPGRYAYEYADVKLLDTPVLIGGKQGLWEVDDQLL